MKSFFILAAMVLPAFAQFGISVAAPKESARVTISQPLLVEVDKEVRVEYSLQSPFPLLILDLGDGHSPP